MISCIICSRRPDVSAELKENIANTIGCKYELVVIDNSKNEYSIFSAYNEGVRRAKGDVLCFMHEDISYHTEGWGTIVINTFDQYPEYGLFGVAGSQVLPKSPTPWCSTLFTASTVFSDLLPAVSSTLVDINRNIVPAVVVDGVWMSMPRDLFKTIRFDDTTYEGFHMYDIDTCLQVLNEGLKVGVITSISIYHSSMGNYNVQWFDNMGICWKKWENLLPYSVIDNPEITQKTILYFDHVYNEMYFLRKDSYKMNRILSSHAYKIGCAILYPLKKMRALFQNLIV